MARSLALSPATPASRRFPAMRHVVPARPAYSVARRSMPTGSRTLTLGLATAPISPEDAALPSRRCSGRSPGFAVAWIAGGPLTSALILEYPELLDATPLTSD